LRYIQKSRDSMSSSRPEAIPLNAPAEGICAIMVTYNGGAVIANTVGAIIGQVGQLLIVDNHSDAFTLECIASIKRHFPTKVRTILNPQNAGIAAALNQGVAFAVQNEFQWVLTIDQDSQADSRMIGEMLQTYEGHPEKDRIAIMAPHYVLLNSTEDENECLHLNTAQHPQQVEMVYTSGSLVKTSIFARVGLFREEFFMDHVDSDFCYRLRRSGYKIVTDPKALLIHRLGNMRRARFMGRPIFCTHYSPARYYYRTRNSIVLYRELKDWRLITRFITATIKELIKILLYEKQKVIKIWLIGKGILDGLLGHLGQLE
jgi:rhamnosyltransferase